MAVSTRRIAMMPAEEVELLLQELGWRPEGETRLTNVEKKSILRGLLKDLPVVDQSIIEANQNLDRMSKAELRQICVELDIHLRGNESRKQLTRKIMMKQSPMTEGFRLSDDLWTDCGKHRGRTYDWIWNNDPTYCLWAMDTAVEQGSKCGAGLKGLAEFIDERLQRPTQAGSDAASSSTTTTPAAMAPSRPSLPLIKLPVIDWDNVENPDWELEKLQEQVDEMKSQLARWKQKTARLETDRGDTQK